MRRTDVLQGIRLMKFEEILDRTRSGELSQDEAGLVLGVSERTFRRRRERFEVISAKGLFCALYADRASHYWHTPEAGGKVDRDNPTQVGRALNRLGIELIPAYSPQARGRQDTFVHHATETPAATAQAGRDHHHGRGQPVAARDLASPTTTGTSPFGRNSRIRPSRRLAATDAREAGLHEGNTRFKLSG